MFEKLIEKLTGKVAGAAAGAAADVATGGVTRVGRIIVWLIENPLVVLFFITTLVFSIMYGCERLRASGLEDTVDKITAELKASEAAVVLCEGALKTCNESVQTYKSNVEACETTMKKQQLAYGDLISIIQSKCVTQQKIDDAVKKAEQQKKTTGVYTAAELVAIYNDMIKARFAAVSQPPAAPGGVR